MDYQLSLFSRISQLLWWQDYKEVLKEETFSSFWHSLASEELETRIKIFSITPELLNDFLYFHVADLINHDGYLLLPLRKLKFTLFLNLDDDKSNLESGVVHEAAHFIYRVRGAGISVPCKNEEKIENLIEDEAKRFVKENEGIVLELLNKYFKLD